MVRTLRRFESVQRIDLTRHFIYYAICKSLSKRINKEIPTLSLPLLWGRSPPTRNRCDRYGKAEPVPTEKGEMRVRSKDDSPDERKRRDDVTGRQVRTPTWHLLPFGSRHVADVGKSPGRERWDLRSTRGLSGHEATRDAGSHVREHDWWKACGTRGQLKSHPIDRWMRDSRTRGSLESCFQDMDCRHLDDSCRYDVRGTCEIERAPPHKTAICVCVPGGWSRLFGN